MLGILVFKGHFIHHLGKGEIFCPSTVWFQCLGKYMCVYINICILYIHQPPTEVSNSSYLHCKYLQNFLVDRFSRFDFYGKTVTPFQESYRDQILLQDMGTSIWSGCGPPRGARNFGTWGGDLVRIKKYVENKQETCWFPCHNKVKNLRNLRNFKAFEVSRVVNLTHFNHLGNFAENSEELPLTPETEAMWRSLADASMVRMPCGMGWTYGLLFWTFKRHHSLWKEGVMKLLQQTFL